MILSIFTLVHTLISLVAIFTGFVVLFAMLSNARVNTWTKWFLTAAIATTVTGFFFPFHGFTPGIVLGIITIPFFLAAVYARYSKGLAGPWRWIYVISALLLLFFNMFVAIVQSFEKIPALHALAPTQTEPPFKLAQLINLAFFAVMILVAAVRFHPGAAPAK